MRSRAGRGAGAGGAVATTSQQVHELPRGTARRNLPGGEIPGLSPLPPRPPAAKTTGAATHPASLRPLGHARPTAALPGKTAPLTKPVAGSLDACGTLVGTGKRTTALQHHEMQQAGYQLAAKLNGTPIEDPGERRRLADANQTMHDTRLALRHGRGNVEADHRLSGGYGAIATAVSEQLAGPNDNMLAGTALALGAGKCEAYVEINNRVHSQKLRPRETVVGMVNSDLGLETVHTWSEIHKNPEPGTKKPSPIVMDSWGTGPAARLEDTVWAAHSRTTQEVARFGKLSGKTDFDKMQQIRRLYERSQADDTRRPPPEGVQQSGKATFAGEPGGGRHAAAMKLVSERRPATGRMLQDVQLIKPAFAANAREKLRAMSAFSQEVMAVGAAREAYALNVAQAAKLVTTAQVIDEAGRLDRQDRPPVVRRDGSRDPL